MLALKGVGVPAVCLEVGLCPLVCNDIVKDNGIGTVLSADQED